MQRFRQRLIPLAGLVAVSMMVWLGQTASAQGKSAQGKSAQGKHTDKSDRTFVHMASSGGLAEVRLGQLAAERAYSAEVRQFGQRMVDDHTKANQELAAIAQAKNLQVATEMDKKHQAMADKLAKLSGAAFDREYMAAQVADHEHTVALFTTTAREGQDPELKTFASRTLPTLQEHLRMARGLADKQPNERAQR